MISVAEAKKIIESHAHPLKPVKVSIAEAAGKVLAEDIYSNADFPPFPQSSMDGYAFRFEDWQKKTPLVIEGEMAAGVTEKMILAPGKATRIFTGAPLPQGADTVIMQEKTQIKEGQTGEKLLVLTEEDLQSGANVRPKGSEIRKGTPALEKNSLLSPASIGFLAGIGIAEVLVFPHPSISVIITGKELQVPGKLLHFGQVYESNSLALSAVLQQFHFNDIKIFRADDDISIVTRVFGSAMQQSDLVLLSGGISVGEYDFVLQAADNCGVTKLFHKIKQRPGKPLYFGKIENKLVFGLPGNPSSVLTCFYEYVLMALEILTKKRLTLPTIKAPLDLPFRKTALLTNFLKGFYNGEVVEILPAQESFRLSSFAKANCLVQIDEEIMNCEKGEMVTIHLIPV
jgi:molybdopterin molybdotransferase